MPATNSAYSKRFAYRLALAIQADCITWRDYIPWADRLIEHMDKPPVWICELATHKYKPDALDAVSAFVMSDPPENSSAAHGEFFGYLWIRYERRELSWATFLNEAGKRADVSIGPWGCEYFYSKLNEFEAEDFSPEVEERHRQIVRGAFASEISGAREVYDEIRRKG